MFHVEHKRSITMKRYTIELSVYDNIYKNKCIRPIKGKGKYHEGVSYKYRGICIYVKRHVYDIRFQSEVYPE